MRWRSNRSSHASDWTSSLRCPSTVSAIWQAAQWSGLKMRLWADEHEVEGNFILAVATNIRHYMGGLSNLSPDAFIDDGLLDLWLFSGSNLGDALRHAYDLWRG